MICQCKITAFVSAEIADMTKFHLLSGQKIQERDIFPRTEYTDIKNRFRNNFICK